MNDPANIEICKIAVFGVNCDRTIEPNVEPISNFYINDTYDLLLSQNYGTDLPELIYSPECLSIIWKVYRDSDD